MGQVTLISFHFFILYTPRKNPKRLRKKKKRKEIKRKEKTLREMIMSKL